ncbi:MarR family winged helix-turn-helix transcriptional regulator [Nakamurella aerolata]|uniref:MarR family winged helix-turn-helix transcriptional regulator n=1 Tax=Nakamurella aerolata TaxID=1656892 RepID=UPI001BB28F13|nr:MarR family transcriptional regulator [Nakamurella aerolata]
MKPAESANTVKGGNRASTDPLSLDEQVCFALVVATRGLLNVYRPILRPLGLTHPQYLVMLVLWDAASSGEIAVTGRHLVRTLGLDAGTLSPLLKRLESAGLIRRSRDANDERQLAISLTREGLALRERALAVPPAVVEELGMSEAELTQLRRTLHRLIAATATADQNGTGQHGTGQPGTGRNSAGHNGSGPNGPGHNAAGRSSAPAGQELPAGTLASARSSR